MDNATWNFIALVLITIFLYMLPFIPAWYEWKFKTDAQPFEVNFQDRNVVEYRIRLFRNYISNHFTTILANYTEQGTSVLTMQNNGNEVYITGQGEALALDEKDRTQQATRKTTLFVKNGMLPNSVAFEKKVYAGGSLITGEADNINEVYVENEIIIQSKTTINDLVYAGKTIKVSQGVDLNGYAQAEDCIQFVGPASFRFLKAAVIRFDTEAPLPSIQAMDIIGEPIERSVIEKPHVVPEQSKLKQHLVVKAPLTINSHCTLRGNIKCYKDVKIDSNTSIVGAIFGKKAIIIGDNCTVQGPIVTDGDLLIGENCFIGSSDSKTSLVANTIQIGKGCIITGQILAKNTGIYQGATAR